MLRDILKNQAAKEWRINALDHQQTPGGDDWTTWLMLGGRGAGKTRAGAEWIRALVNGRVAHDGAPYQKARAIALVAETYADAREVMIDGPSGIIACAAGGSRPTFEASRRRVVWPNGAVAHCFSAEDPDGIRGYQFDAAWSDEAGCPAVDKGANQPNVFVDPKSSESAVPYYSTGRRDDMAQRRFLEAQGVFWSDPAKNPVSSVYSEPMVDSNRRYVYAYDARPFPDFPARSDVWGDAANWETGHWLNGRLGRAPLDLLVEALGKEAGFTNLDASALDGVVTGYLIDRALSPREMIDPLADVFQFDVVDAGDVLRCQPRNAGAALTIDTADFAARDDGAFSLSLAQETDLPAAFRLGFFNEAEDFSPAVAEARDPGADPHREVGIDIAAAVPAAEAEARARSILADAWVMREQLSFELAPTSLALEPGDTVALESLGTDRLYRITDIEDGATRRVDLVRVAPTVYESPVGPTQFSTPPPVAVPSAPSWELFELPLIEGGEAGAPWFAAFADPWPGGVALYRGGGDTAPVLAARAPARAVMGRLKTPLAGAGAGRWIAQSVDVELAFGALSSKAAEDIFSGANLCAIESDAGGWELAQFQNAELQPDGRWRLSGFLRGQAGSETEALAGAGAEKRFVLISPAVTQAQFPIDLRGLSLDWQAGPEADIPDTENFTSKTLTFEARGLKPLSPVHLRARREGDDLRLSWIPPNPRRRRQLGRRGSAC